MINERVKIKIESDVVIGLEKPSKEVKIKIDKPVYVSLKLARALNNDYMIYDHPLYDVVIMPSKNKITTFAKRDIYQDAYPSQDKFFTFMASKGLINRESIKAGNVFNSLEAQYPINNDIKTIQAILYVIYNFFQDEIPMIQAAYDFDMDTDEDMYSPSEEESTELGEVPQAAKKGSIDPSYRPYGLVYRI